MKKRCIYIIACVFVSCFLFGCQNDAIQFYRESKVSQVMRDMQAPQRATVKRSSSGVMIYKDAPTERKGQNVKFGPSDLNFGIGVK